MVAVPSYLRPRAPKSKHSKKYHFAVTMRHRPTTAEAVLWGALVGAGLSSGWKRQAIFDFGIVDFYHRGGHLVIEVDGGYHGDLLQAKKDQERDEILQAREIEVY